MPGVNLLKQMNGCKHQRQELRIMRHCGQYRMQCIDCWQSIGNAIKHELLSAEERDLARDFDIEARDNYWKNRIESRNSGISESARQDLARIAKDLDDRKRFYNEYLKSDDWRKLRRKVIERESDLCQGCRGAPIQEVHHLNYDRLGNELLTDLVGVCRSCHLKFHPDKQ